MEDPEMEAFKKTLASLIELAVVVGSYGGVLSMDGTYRIGIPVLDDRVAALATYIESSRHLKNVKLILGRSLFSQQHGNIARAIATACAKRNTRGSDDSLPPINLKVDHHLHPSWIPSAANFFSSFGSHITELYFLTRGMDHEKPMVEIIAPLCQRLKLLAIYVITGPNTTSVLSDLLDISSTCELHFVIVTSEDYPQVHNALVLVSPMLSNNLGVLLDSQEQHFGLRETTSLVTWLQQMHQLALFGLEIKSISAAGLQVLSDYLQQNSSIREFMLDVAEVQPNRSAILETTFGNVLSSKSKVSLSMFGDAPFGLAYQILSRSNRLEDLKILSRYKAQYADDGLVSDDSFVLIAEGIKQSSSLRELFIGVSYIIQEQENESGYGLDITPIAKALTLRQQGPNATSVPLCCPLVALTLNVNIKPVAIPHLTQALTDPSSRLENLDICSYFYSGEDAISLVEAVRDNQSLENVEFRFSFRTQGTRPGMSNVIYALPAMLAEMEPLKMFTFVLIDAGTLPVTWLDDAGLSRELNIGLMDNQSLQYVSIEASPFPSYRDPAGNYRFDMAREDVFNCCERNVEHALFIAAFPAHPDPMTALLKELDTTRGNPIGTTSEQVLTMLFCCFSSRPDLIGGPRRQQGESSTLLREEP